MQSIETLGLYTSTEECILSNNNDNIACLLIIL